MPPDPVGTINNRIRELERQVAKLLAHMTNPTIGGGVVPVEQVRRARTATPESDPYPTDPSKTYPIMFLDGTFDNEDINTTGATNSDRSAYPTHYAYSDLPDDELIPVNTILWVVLHRGKWWILSVALECEE